MTAPMARSALGQGLGRCHAGGLTELIQGVKLPQKAHDGTARTPAGDEGRGMAATPISTEKPSWVRVSARSPAERTSS